MTDEARKTLLEKLAYEVATFANPDAPAVERLTGAFEELARTFGDHAPRGVRESLDTCLASLRAMQKKGAKKIDEKARGVVEEFTRLQDLCAAADEDSGTAPRRAGGFELPEWVDESVFFEFLGQQKVVLEEIESDILALEERGPEGVASLKRRFHTMKGEAGVLGLGSLEKACHAVEELLVSGPASTARVDKLLHFKDWVSKLIESLSGARAEAVSLDEILAILSASGSCEPQGADAKAPAAAPMNEAKKEDGKASDGPKNPIYSARLTRPAPSPTAAPPGANAVEALVWDEEMISTFSDFFQESDEGLAQADQILMAAERGEVNADSVNSLFRTFHTIKGLAGFLDLKEISSLAHTTETMLNQVRQGHLALEDAVLDLTFDSTGLMRKMLRAARASVERREGFSPTPELPPHLKKLDAAIQGKVPAREPAPMAAPGMKLGEILSSPPMSVAPEVVEAALESQKESGRKLGEELLAKGGADARQVAMGLRAQNLADGDGHGSAKIKETVKVDVDRVDNLVEMIGELVIVESMVVNAEEISSIPSPRVRNCLSQLGRLTRDLQDVGMRMRMVPLRSVFQKMARLVRDLSRKKGVPVTFLVAGEGTEMDRSMVEQIADPLVHMIRNAVDHGIETAEGRKSAGKPAHGEVRLSAYHEAGNIVVELSDDGAGLNKEAILKKAIEQKLINENDKLTDADIYNLIFVPGFSTAKQVTEISGRGVGMDVVRRNIEAVRGRMSIHSVPGVGTTFKMVLPLTLAIIDGMLVASGSERYIVPTLSVIESMVLQSGMSFSLAGKNELINVRGDVLPLLRLDRLFATEGAKTALSEGLVVVVEGVGRKFGIFVDDVLTQQQVVIKTLGSGMNQTKLISGAAILSDGKVGLILNVDEIGSLIDKSATRSSQHAQTLGSGDMGVNGAPKPVSA